MQYLDLLFVLVIGFAIGRTVGYYMQLRSEREWTACLERLGGWSAPPVARGGGGPPLLCGAAREMGCSVMIGKERKCPDPVKPPCVANEITLRTLV